MTEKQTNYARMFTLIDEVFETRNDPEQIQVSPAQLKKLQKIHPSTLSELADSKGPYCWILIIPTTQALMQQFLKGEISEKRMLQKTKLADSYECIYLCSATMLSEYRGKGDSKKLTMKAIKSICKDHPIKTLFVWPFTKEGLALAKSIAQASKLKLELFNQKKIVDTK